MDRRRDPHCRLGDNRRTSAIAGARRYAELLRGGRWFATAPDALQERLLDAASVRKLAPGEWLFARGDAPTGLFAVVEGAVRIAAAASSGREILLARMEPPMWFGEISVLDGQPRTHDAIADGASAVLQVAQASLDALLDAEPRFWRHLGLLAATKLRLSFLAIEEAAALPLAVRLARRLVLSAERYGEWERRSSRVVDLRQEELATMLSTSRQTVNRLLKGLESRGIVKLSYRHVEILDLDALREIGLGEAPRGGDTPR